MTSTHKTEEETDFAAAFRDAWKRFQRTSEKNLSATGVTVTELRILKILSVDGPVPMTKFASDLFMTPASVTGLIDKLESEGLVERERGTEDRRVVNAKITSKGRERLDVGSKLNRQFTSKALGKLSGSESRELIRLLDKMVEGAESA